MVATFRQAAARALLPLAGLLAIQPQGLRRHGASAASLSASLQCSGAAETCKSPSAVWLQRPRSACAVYGDALTGGPQGPARAWRGCSGPAGAGTFSAADAPVTYVPVTFASPLAPDGPKVEVAMALVDTGSSDCELREGLLRRLWPLPLLAEGVVYETAVGQEAYDVYEVLLTVQGRTCATAVTVVADARFEADAEEPCTDEAMVGHAALAALQLLVDPAARTVVPRGPWPPV